MHVRYYKEYSQHLQRDMEFKVYGHAGLPMIVFPCQDGKFYDFEDRGMVNTVADRLETSLSTRLNRVPMIPGIYLPER